MKVAMTEKEHFYDIKDVTREWVEEHAERPVHVVVQHECPHCKGEVLYIGKGGHVRSRVDAIAFPLAAAHSLAAAAIDAQPDLAPLNKLGFILMEGDSIPCATAARVLLHLKQGGIPADESLADVPPTVASVMSWLEDAYDGTSQQIFDLLVSLPPEKALLLLKKIVRFDIGIRNPEKYLAEVLLSRE